ncbi:DUF4231 domain-containing protein [Microcystis aeruginosa]|uniref:DUF4231 domain-containing protein n=1 Tax=Microcystis aeruginosa TaxID=1126 RepID=UPI00287FEDD0|nr:DUF4231 domain-containing protein [Microcystis aeruginosa]WNF14871.1 DUF4231 domain-containing protein [Microcystis aeruginosa NRERC-214]
MPENALEIKNLEKTSKPYRDQFKQEICTLIEQIDLSDLQKQFMKARWLDQLLWLEGRAQTTRNQYYFLRLLTIIGGVIVPALVSLNINANDVKVVVSWLAFGLSQVVAISAAVEEFFHYGERYRHYRNTAEAMKIEGWQFLQLSGSYRHAQSYAEVYPDFAQRVENIIQRDVEGYFSKVVQEKEKPKQQAEIAKTPPQ